MKGKDLDNNKLQNECDNAVDKPATYCIRVVGYLDKSWSERMGG